MQKKKYYTTDERLLSDFISLAQLEPKLILEPCFGRGDIVQKILTSLEHVEKIVCVEIDSSIETLDSIIDDRVEILYMNFFDYEPDAEFCAIILNPPFIKNCKNVVKNSVLPRCNSYLLFIEKCISHLKHGGELISIVPNDIWVGSVSKKLLNEMKKIGKFTDIINYKNIDMFRYIKTKDPSSPQTPSIKGVRFGDLFYIKHGILPANKSIIQHDYYGNREVLTSNGKFKYILLDQFPTSDDDLNSYMLLKKDEIMCSKIKKITDSNWFEFGIIRNYKFMTDNAGKKCIFVPLITRNKFFFKDVMQVYDSSLISIFPKLDIDLDEVVEKLNSEKILAKFKFGDRYRFTVKTLEELYF
jgi:hypothetical protein